MSFISDSPLKQASYALHTEQTGRAFAADIVRRMRGASEAQAAQNARNPDSAADESLAMKQENLQKLESSLSSLVAWMSGEHGDKAATAMMGIIYKRAGNGEINEENLGQAMLDVTRFIDNNFGFAAGDAFLEELNGSLNESLNAYFENGADEQFFAVTNGQVSGLKPDTSIDAAELGSRMAESIMKLIEEARLKNNENSGNSIYAGKREKLLGLLRDQMA